MKLLSLTPFVLVIATALLLVSCDQGPLDYGKFERRTIEANLAAIDSASSIYATQFAAGNIDAGAQQAQAFLLTQEGVDTAVISPDNTVWAFFASGLMAGTGDVSRDTTGEGAMAAGRGAAVRTASGGEAWPPAHFVVPFGGELPGTQRSVDALEDILLRKLGTDEYEAFTGSEVDLGVVEGLINPGTGLLFWAGHGTLVPRDTQPTAFDGGLVLGKTYARQALADAAVRQFAGYLNPTSGQPRQAAVIRFVGKPYFSVVVLPGFIRAHGDFDNAESLPFNSCKTVVYLSCCFSATEDPTSALMDAFRAAGADLVCGWSWAVGDAFACDVDTTILGAMADTCLAAEAFRMPKALSDPVGYKGGRATFTYYGDTLLLLQAVLDAKKGGTLFRSGAGARAEMYGSQATKLYDWVRHDGSAEEAALVTFLFPSTAPGSFDLFSSGAYISWADIATGRTYWAQAGYIGTGGTLNIDRCTDSLVVGHFSARLGWWDAGKSPYADQPDDTFSLEEGVLKYSGKITHLGAGALLPQPGQSVHD